jgi:gliding motility-associated lipoprotein GldD
MKRFHIFSKLLAPFTPNQSTLDRQKSTVNGQSSIVNHQSSIVNGQQPTVNSQQPKISLSWAFLFLVLWGCEDYTAVPKPRAFPRVIYPEKAYKPFDETYCQFTFDQPVYASIEHDTTFFDEKAKNDCWFNITVKQLNAKIFCTYNPIRNRAEFDELVKDSYDMTNKHNIKASYIEEMQVNRSEDHVYGVVFNVEGPAASSYQFFLTDSSKNFVRGALYFNTEARPDSLAPVVAFMREDLDRLVGTLKWNNR